MNFGFDQAGGLVYEQSYTSLASIDLDDILHETGIYFITVQKNTGGIETFKYVK